MMPWLAVLGVPIPLFTLHPNMVVIREMEDNVGTLSGLGHAEPGQD